MTQTDNSSAGHKASLQLSLTAASFALKAALDTRQKFREQADTYRALAAEQQTPGDREAYYGAEMQQRLQAQGQQPEIDRLTKRVNAIQRELNELLATEAAIGEVMA